MTWSGHSKQSGITQILGTWVSKYFVSLQKAGRFGRTGDRGKHVTNHVVTVYKNVAVAVYRGAFRSSASSKHHNLATTFLALILRAVVRVDLLTEVKASQIGRHGRRAQNHVGEACKAAFDDALRLGYARKQSPKDAITIHALKVRRISVKLIPTFTHLYQVTLVLVVVEQSSSTKTWSRLNLLFGTFTAF